MISERYKKGPFCGRLLGEKTLKQPVNVGALKLADLYIDHAGYT
jgi:hypothetical protein